MFGQSQKQKINRKKCLWLLWFHQWNAFRIWWETFFCLIISLAIQLAVYHLPDHWHYLAFSFHSQTSDSCNGSYQGVDLQCVTPSFVIRISPCPSPSTPPPLSHPLLFFLSNPVICLRSSADNNVFYLRVTCTKGPPNWSNARRLMSPQQSAFPNPTGPEGRAN